MAYCKNCGKEIREGVHRCPHCNAEQSSAVPAWLNGELDADAAVKALREIFDHYGAQQVLGSTTLLYNALGDKLGDDGRRLRNQIRTAMDAGLGKLYLVQLQTPIPDFDEQCLRLLTKNAGMNDDTARKLRNLFHGMVGFSISPELVPEQPSPDNKGQSMLFEEEDKIPRSPISKKKASDKPQNKTHSSAILIPVAVAALLAIGFFLYPAIMRGNSSPFVAVSTNSPVPTDAPTKMPTQTPTQAPTKTPTKAPTSVPTAAPTAVPTATPVRTPTLRPTVTPAPAPTPTPVQTPTLRPTATPAPMPTPVRNPTLRPTVTPAPAPTPTPVRNPTLKPTATPAPAPTPTPVQQLPPVTQLPPVLLPPKPTPVRQPTLRPTATPAPAPTPTPVQQLPPVTQPPPVLLPPKPTPVRQPTLRPTATPASAPKPTPIQQLPPVTQLPPVLLPPKPTP